MLRDLTNLVVNAGDFRRDNISRGSSRRAVEHGSTPGWLMHCSIFHLEYRGINMTI